MMIKDSALTMPRTCVAADMVVALDSVDSTNTYAAEQLREGHLFGSEKYISADGFSMCDWTGREIVAICADEQTAGRGRLDHQWVSVKGESLIVSLVATVPASIVRDTSVNGWLQMIAGLAVRDAVAGVVIDFDGTLDGKIELKWPNDIFVGGKKLGGVLAEMVPLAGTSAAEEPDMDGGSAGSAGSEEGASKERVGIVFGIGLNLDVPESRLPSAQATSMQLVATGMPDTSILRDAIAARLVEGLRKRLTAFEENPHGEAESALKEMTAACWTIGKPCEAHFVDGGSLHGTALWINRDASITIKDENGDMHVVHTADVGVLAK